MSQTIRGFQEDQAILLQDQITKELGDSTTSSVERIVTLFVKHGVVSDYTLWKKIDEVLQDLGIDYDEIFEVAR